MRFENFDLQDPSGNVIVLAFGKQWDLHNFAIFKGFEFAPSSNTLLLGWEVPPDETNPWGDMDNTASACRIECRGLRTVSISARTPTSPSDSDCLRAISKVQPGGGDFPFKDQWNADEEFDLLLEFEDERQITIDCDLAAFQILD